MAEMNSTPKRVRAGSGAKWRDMRESKLRYWDNLYHSDFDGESGNIAATKNIVNKMVETRLTYGGEELRLENVKEITDYYYEDHYNASLALVETKRRNGKEIVILEVKLAPRTTMKTPNIKVGEVFRDANKQQCERSTSETCEEEAIKSRISGLSVSTNYDSKELVFRNKFRSISSSFQPVAKIVYNPGQFQTLDLIWVDPHGDLAAVNR